MNVSTRTEPNRPKPFAELLPRIERVIRRRLRRYRRQEREELQADAVASAYLMYCRLSQQGRGERIFPTPLATYGVRQALDGRSVGSPMNRRDLTSRYSQRRTGVRGHSLSQSVPHSNRWQELVVEDRRTTPAEIAATRIDFRAWLKTLTRRQRQIAAALGGGETTTQAAQLFGVSHGRISQLRRELKVAWERFQGEHVPEAV